MRSVPSEQPHIPDHRYRCAGNDVTEIRMPRVDGNVAFPACHNRGHYLHYQHYQRHRSQRANPRVTKGSGHAKVRMVLTHGLNGLNRQSAMRQACHDAVCSLEAAFGLHLTGSLRHNALGQRPVQVLNAARTEFSQRHVDRPLAAQHGVAGPVLATRRRVAHMWSIITSQSVARPHEHLMCVDTPLADGPVHSSKPLATPAAASYPAKSCSDGTRPRTSTSSIEVCPSLASTPTR
jgi:hypothetical protein